MKNETTNRYAKIVKELFKGILLFGRGDWRVVMECIDYKKLNI